MNIISRSEWGARPPKSTPYRMSLPAAHLFLHHTAGSEPDGQAGMRQIQDFHQRTRAWNDFAYSFAVDRLGAVFEGRGAGVVGAHTQGLNSKSHAICVLGNYERQTPTRASLDAVVALVRHGYQEGWWPAPKLTGGHRDAPGARTACPGKHLYARIPELNLRASAMPLTPEPEQEEDPMLLFRASDDNKVYVLLGDRKAHIPSGQQLEEAGFDPAKIRVLSPGHFLLRLPEVTAS